jgi:hypothetical protein
LGAAKAGATIVPTSVKNSEELAKIIKDTGASGILFSPNSKL